MTIQSKFYGYKHWTLEEAPRCFYVGKGVIVRPTSKARNHKWKAVVERYGVHVEICMGPVSNEEACAWEIENILRERTYTINHDHDNFHDIGCNFTKGGEGSTGHTCHHSLEARQKMSNSHKGKRLGSLHPMYGKKHSEKSKALMGRSSKLNPNFGRQRSAEHCQKLREANLGKVQSDESNEKRRNSMKKYLHDHPDECTKRSVRSRGENNPRSKLTREQALEIKRKYVPRKYSYTKLAKEFGVSTKVISHVINGTIWSDVDPAIREAYDTYRK